jgi:2-iminobutanoate/2-iminopropanoate deaminase
MSRNTILTPDAPAPIGPYSQGISASGPLVFVAGQIPVDPKTGQVVAPDIVAQTRRVLTNVEAILRQAGCSMADVVRTTVFMTDLGEFTAMNEVYGEFFTSNPPARSTVQVSRLPKDVRVEIDAIAVMKG